jgi:hypothetical protein
LYFFFKLEGKLTLNPSYLTFQPSYENDLTKLYGRSHFSLKLNPKDLRVSSTMSVDQVPMELIHETHPNLSRRYHSLSSIEKKSTNILSDLISSSQTYSNSHFLCLKVVKKQDPTSIFLFGLDSNM